MPVALIATATLVVGVSAGALVTRAVASTPDNSVSGCFNTKSGALRLLTNNSPTCTASETSLSWNQEQPATRWYRDWDGDGYGDWYRFVDSPAQPPGYVANNSDCNDNESGTNPGLSSDPGPGDRNCNGIEAEDQQITWYHDSDGDGWGATKDAVKAPMSAPPAGYVYRFGDCDDNNAGVHPYQTQCHPGGSDIDGDGHKSTLAGGDDCNDADANEFPGNNERTDNYGHDEDCDQTTGGVLLFDPSFLDPRPHAGGLMEQEQFRPNGNLMKATRAGFSTPFQPCQFSSGCGWWFTPPLYSE